jgi:predicted nucleic acid-binding protein
MSSERDRVFLDTNIFVYTFDSSSPRKRERARKLVTQALESRSGVISYQVVQEFLNVATRKFTKPMTPSEAQVYLSRVLMPLCEVFPDASLYSHALSIADETGLSFYDSLILSSASAADCPVLLSADLQHGRTIRGVQIRNPFLTPP